MWNDLHTKDHADSHRLQTCSGTRRPTTLLVLSGVKAPTRWIHDNPAGGHLTTFQLVHCILSSLLLNIYGNGNEMPRFSAYTRRLQVTWVSQNGGTCAPDLGAIATVNSFPQGQSKLTEDRGF